MAVAPALRRLAAAPRSTEGAWLIAWFVLFAGLALNCHCRPAGRGTLHHRLADIECLFRCALHLFAVVHIHGDKT